MVGSAPDVPASWRRFHFASRTKQGPTDWRVLVAGFAPHTRPKPASPNVRQERFSFHLVLAGESSYLRSDDKPITIRPGSYFMLHPQRPAPYPRVTPGFLEAVLILDWNSAREAVDLGLLELEPSHGHSLPDHDLGMRFAELVEQMSGNAEPAFPLLDALFWIRAVRARSLPQASDPRQLAMDRACQLLGSQLTERVSPRQVARELGWSYETFRKQFRAATGLAPGAYRIRKRIEAAWGMLAAGEPVATVARRLGYCDPFVFSTQFKEQTGQAPSAARIITAS